jgi:hypothetical protein
MKNQNQFSYAIRHSIFNVSILFILIIFCSNAYSQDKPSAPAMSPASNPATGSGDKKFAMAGITELSGNISYSSYSEVDNGQTSPGFTIFNVAPQIGHFITNGLEIGLNSGVSFLSQYGFNGLTVISSSGGGQSMSILQIFGSLSYNFKTGGEKVYPYLEFQYGYTSLSEGGTPALTTSGSGYGICGGIKVVAVSHLLFNISIQYTSFSLNDSSIPVKSGINYLSVGVGVGGFL